MNEVLSRLNFCGAIIRDSHFVYTSGRHGPCYVNKDAIYPHTDIVSLFCWLVAGRFRDAGIGVVAAPAIGGVALSQWVAHHLDPMYIGITTAVFAEKGPDGVFRFNRGYDRLVAGRQVLVVEDVLTTGGSLRGVIAAVRACGGILAGACALVNRGGVTAEDVGSDVGLDALVTIEFESFVEEDCPLCRAGVPINTDVGKGREFLARKAASEGLP